MVPVTEYEALVPAENLRRTHVYPQLISVLNIMGRVNVHVVHHEIRVLPRDHVDVGERRRHCHALAVAAQIEVVSKVKKRFIML